MAERWPALGVECPCGCGVVASLTRREPCHARGCGDKLKGATKACRQCQGRRSNRKGKRSQSKGYRGLGGRAVTSPTHEEWFEPLQINVRFENKAGAQIPASFVRFAHGDWFEAAIGQARRACAIGGDAYPAVRIDLLDRGPKYLVVIVP